MQLLMHLQSSDDASRPDTQLHRRLVLLAIGAAETALAEARERLAKHQPGRRVELDGPYRGLIAAARQFTNQLTALRETLERLEAGAGGSSPEPRQP